MSSCVRAMDDVRQPRKGDVYYDVDGDIILLLSLSYRYLYGEYQMCYMYVYLTGRLKNHGQVVMGSKRWWLDDIRGGYMVLISGGGE